MIKKADLRVTRLTALGMIGSIVSMMSEAIGLGLGLACVVVVLAGPGSGDVIEGRSVAGELRFPEAPDKVARVDQGASACDGVQGQW